MKVVGYVVEARTGEGEGRNFPNVFPSGIPGDWFPFIPRVKDCFWHQGVYWQIESLAYHVGEGSHESIYIELMVSYAGLK